jgi:hypothetical protein
MIKALKGKAGRHAVQKGLRTIRRAVIYNNAFETVMRVGLRFQATQNQWQRVSQVHNGDNYRALNVCHSHISLR